MKPNTIIQGDALTELQKLPDQCVDCIITSPPYWALRDYNVEGQLGLEGTPEEYALALREVFKEASRVLKDTGTLWINIGDTYSMGSRQAGTGGGRRAEKSAFKNPGVNYGMRPKNLMGIPWMVAFALRGDGWYLRQDIIWHKPNPMPESATDRCTRAHEYVFMFSKSPMYYYDADAIKTPTKDPADNIRRIMQQKASNASAPVGKKSGLRPREYATENRRYGYSQATPDLSSMKDYAFANKRSVWNVPAGTVAYGKAHTAVFPEKLIEPMVLAGAPPRGIILDPFMGTGTTALVAKKLGRQYFGIELNGEHVKTSEKRLRNVPDPLF